MDEKFNRRFTSFCNSLDAFPIDIVPFSAILKIVDKTAIGLSQS